MITKFQSKQPKRFYSALQKLNGCFDLAVVILVTAFSDTQDAYQFRVYNIGIGMLEVN